MSRSLDKYPPIEPELRARILADPNVAQAAAAMGVELEDFVNQIGFYAKNPHVQPEVQIVSDQELIARGHPPPTLEEIEREVRKSVAVANAGNMPTGYDFPAHWDPKLRIPRGQVVAAASIVSPKY